MPHSRRIRVACVRIPVSSCPVPLAPSHFPLQCPILPYPPPPPPHWPPPTASAQARGPDSPSPLQCRFVRRHVLWCSLPRGVAALGGWTSRPTGAACCAEVVGPLWEAGARRWWVQGLCQRHDAHKRVIQFTNVSFTSQTCHSPHKPWLTTNCQLRTHHLVFRHVYGNHMEFLDRPTTQYVLRCRSVLSFVVIVVYSFSCLIIGIFQGSYRIPIGLLKVFAQSLWSSSFFSHDHSAPFFLCMRLRLSCWWHMSVQFSWCTIGQSALCSRWPIGKHLNVGCHTQATRCLSR